MKQKKSTFEVIYESIGFVQIAIAPFLVGGIIGFFIYQSHPDTLRLILAIGLSLAGLILGIWIARRKWKKEGTAKFMSNVRASKEMNHLDSEERNS